ncbi:protein-methionine-sulfoxide reductase catalytic subunit MsrP [Roseovarius sp. TE539]|uniref:protein-methionine-sulfoxide reductase catalytic subunit MsrP n=1 Tax=Roseovarius sp. TE539 TaxID=2249812 RepID=UPI000DDF30EA|nr:protein-methionine-sulfoxide reductase catalytic subunit MsrP [Roseovarius sp. TE539]RBI76112.1 protein-methionine-sulfoxide reductase catalytic subunit MsrP [Roseovarius sp. TE539]
MALRWRNDLRESDITPEPVFLDRRQVVAGAAAGMALTAATGRPAWAEALEPNTWEEITTYNNYYEFGTDKGDPARYAHMLTTSPWTVKIDGMVERPGDYAFEDIMKKMTVEERIYRLRCVERWAMVVPWSGFELADLLDLAGVRSSARYVAFQTAYRPEEMPGVKFPVVEWPYVEGLRLDEAMHPLTIMATGLYGKDMPSQNGAPLRVVVPWKYGYKSIKSVVRITLTDSQPPTTWNKYSAREYGFYSNVNPNVDHPRWSQKYETRVGGGLFAKKERTRMFNGYEEEVAHLYEGMDLEKYH